jgi:hypothetical protein
MNETPEAKPSHGFDPIQFALDKPLATPAELAVAFGQLIDSIADITNDRVARIVTPTLSAITVSWQADTVPSAEWLGEVEAQVAAFAACTGVQIHFRRH